MRGQENLFFQKQRLRKRIGQVFYLLVHARADDGLHLGVREHVEPLVLDRVDHLTRDLGGGQAAGHDLLQQLAADLVHLGFHRVAQVVGAVAIGFGDARLHEARAEDRHAHGQRVQCQLALQGLRDGDDRVLRRVVGAHHRRRGETGDRSGVHDVAFVLLDEPRHERADPVDDPPQVHPEHPRPVGLGELPHRAARAHAGVVADDVERAELVHRPRGQRIDVDSLGHVGADGEHPGAALADLADLLGRHRERVILDVGHHDVHPFCGERVGQRSADAAGGAGDDRDLALEVLHVPTVQEDRYSRCSGVRVSISTPMVSSLSREISRSMSGGTG